MKAAILALIIGGLVLGGIAAADPITVDTNLAGPVTLEEWLNSVSIMVVTMPAFSTWWGSAIADATNIDDYYQVETKDMPYTSTAIMAGIGTDANNYYRIVDPDAGLNLTVQSIAALANSTGPIPVFAGSESEFNANAYAASVGVAKLDACGVREAATIAVFNTTAFVTPTDAVSVTCGTGAAIADLLLP
ncbi:MAG: hypothetical protein A4E48_01681 [Methanosaeta sp. PtaU1.Bin060]|jgi:hypothetical protein|nr:MAG: hypothetical protein A4E48_01681 [Methanosaeta sp. PtaU1.Bin060]